MNLNESNTPPWRNRLARSAVNRKVGGSSPPGGENVLSCAMCSSCRTHNTHTLDYLCVHDKAL